MANLLESHTKISILQFVGRVAAGKRAKIHSWQAYGGSVALPVNFADAERTVSGRVGGADQALVGLAATRPTGATFLATERLCRSEG